MTESETVTMSNVIAIASLVSEIWLAMERLNTHRNGLGFFHKVAYDFAKKKKRFLSYDTDCA